MNTTEKRLKKMMVLHDQAMREARAGARIEGYSLVVHHSVAGFTDIEMQPVRKDLGMRSMAHFSQFGAIVALRDIMSRMSVNDKTQEAIVKMIAEATKGEPGPSNEDGRLHEKQG